MNSTLSSIYTPLRVLLVAGSSVQAAMLSTALARLQPAGELATCSQPMRAAKEFQRNPCDVVLVVGSEKTNRSVLEAVFAIARRRGSFVYGGHILPGGVNIGWCAEAGHVEAPEVWRPDIEGSLTLKLHSIQAFRQLWLGYTETSRFQFAMLENVREGAFLVDGSDKVLHANRVAERMLSAPHDSLTGQDVSSLLAATPGNRAQLTAAVPPMCVPGRPDWRLVLLRSGVTPSVPDELPAILQDVLTGLPTHLLMQDRLNKAVHLAARYSRNIGLLCIEVDDKEFTSINETYGYAIGDLVLRELATRLIATVRTVDTVARAGDNRFIAILQELSRSDDASLVAQRMVAACRSPILLDDEIQVTVPVYAGLAGFPEHGKTSVELLSRVEAALTRAKASSATGGTPICAYRADITLTDDRALLEHQLLSVLDDHEMLMFYQPKISVTSNLVIGAEALVRWNCNGSVRGPDSLITLAEELNLIGRITQQAVRDSARQAAAWRQEGKEIPVAVNVPPGEFTDDLLRLISSVLQEFDLPPHLLEIEVTESALGSQNADAPRVMQDLAAMGVRLALDDFGTGYSSLDRLKTFPLNTLKIDRAFIRAIQDAKLVDGEILCSPSAQKDISILRAIVALGKSLQLQIVAEGVEVPEQLEVLRALEVDAWQGYHASPAVPAHEFSAWHEDWHQGSSD